MSGNSSQIHSSHRNCTKNSQYKQVRVMSYTNGEDINDSKNSTSPCADNGFSTLVTRRERPSRACTQRAAARLQAVVDEEVAAAETERKKRKAKRREMLSARLLNEDLDVDEELQEAGDAEDDLIEENGDANGSSSLLRLHRSKIITPLVVEPEASQLPRWRIRSMWQLASILNFLNVFGPLLNIKVEFLAEELETALITPNKTLADIHMPLLKAIPPVTRMALGQTTWITVLCRKLRDWWHWVAEGDLPIFASHGTEVELYNTLDPGIRVVILKALCDIRVEQDDIRNYIDYSIKHSVKMSAFRKERIGGDSRGVSYWFEDDPTIGHRLYREIRTFDAMKGKGKSVPPIPCSSYQWETVATNFDEFQNVSEKLFTSENRIEASVGKKLKRDMLPEIEKVYKKKEKQLKKQHRQALMLDSMISLDDLTGGRSLRDRKPVAYAFDAYDRTINEAIKFTTKKPLSPDAYDGRDPSVKFEPRTNGRLGEPTHDYPSVQFSTSSPKFSDGNEVPDDHKAGMLKTRSRQRRRAQCYSVKELMEAGSDNDLDFDDDEDIVGEVVYDDEYLRKRKQRKMSSSSEGDEEYHLEEETHEEEEDDDNLTSSEESDVPRRLNPSLGRTRRETKLRSVGELRSGLRRSKRAIRNRINYRQYELSETDSESLKPKKPVTLDAAHSNESIGAESSRSSEDSNEKKLNLSHPMEKDHEDPSTRENDPTAEHFTNPAEEENANHENVKKDVSLI